MRHMRQGESAVMREFEAIAAEKGWMVKHSAQEPTFAPEPEHIPEHMINNQDQSNSEERVSEQSGEYVEGLVKQIQGIMSSIAPRFRAALATKSAPNGVDGKWGPKTLTTLSEIALVLGQQNLTDLVSRLTSVRPNVNTLMNILSFLTDIAQKRRIPAPAAVKEEIPKEPSAPLELIKEPHMTQPWQYPTIKELAPKASAIVTELVSLANDLDDMGETKIAEAVDEQLRIYKEAIDKLYDITGETGEQLIGEAHPGGGPTMAPAKEEGGKVETVVEQQKRDIKVVETKPTGKQAVFVAQQLVALANRLDAEGKTEAALLVDKTLDELREGSPRPFVVKVALWGIVALIDALREKINDWAQHEPEYVRNKAETIAKLKNYQRDLYNAQRDNSTKTEAKVTAALDKEFPEIEQSLRAGAPSGTMLMIGAYLRGIKANLTIAEQQHPEWFHDTSPKEQAYEKQLRDVLKLSHKRYLGTVDMLLNGLVKALPDPVKETEANRMLKGKLNETIDWLKKLRQQKEPTSLSERGTLNEYNKILWNSYLRPLKGNPKLADLFASIKNDKIVREAAPPVGIPGAPIGPLDLPVPGNAPAKTPSKGAPAPRGKGVAKKQRPNLQQLQNAMMSAGIPLPSHQADGKWGSETWNAWNALRNAIIERKGPGWDIGRPPAPAGNGPSDQAINGALNMAKHLGRLYSARATVSIAPGIKVQEKSLSDAQAFIKSLSAQPNSGISAKNSPKENAAIALKLAQAYAQSLERDDSDESWALAKEGVDVQARAAIMDRLIGQLRGIGTGIPSYRMPDSSEQGRKQHGGIGEFGTLEGAHGTHGNSHESTPVKSSLEDQVYNLPELSGFTNDPAAFASWAQRYWWDKTKREGEPYVIAHEVIDFLRKEIARLQNTTMRAPRPMRDDLLSELRLRQGEIHDIYTTLPKGR